MLLSVALTVHNEAHYLAQLMDRLWSEWNLMRYDKELVVLHHQAGDKETNAVLHKAAERWGPQMRIFTKELLGDFAAHKNILNAHCKGQWIFQLDADEQPPRGEFLRRLPELLAHADRVEADAFLLPRINLVDGLTVAHLQRWRWKIAKVDGVELTLRPLEEDSPELELYRTAGLVIAEEVDTSGKVIARCHGACVNWPDYQCRLYRKGSSWQGKVHEQLHTERKKLVLPAATAWALEHFKDIQRQEEQNAKYQAM